MPIASIKFTSDFLVEAFQRYRKQHRGKYVGFAIKLLALLLLAPLALWSFGQKQMLLGAFFLFLSVSMFFAHYVDYWLARRSFQKSPYCDEVVTIEFTDEGFHAHSPKQDTKLHWSAFTRVAHFKDGFLLFQGPKFFNWIPVSSLANQSQVGELAALLQSKIPEHKIVEPCVPPNGDPNGGTP